MFNATLVLEYLWPRAPVALEARLFVVFFPNNNGSFWFAVLGKQQFYTACDTEVQARAAFPFFYLLCISLGATVLSGSPKR